MGSHDLRIAEGIYKIGRSSVTLSAPIEITVGARVAVFSDDDSVAYEFLSWIAGLTGLSQRERTFTSKGVVPQNRIVPSDVLKAVRVGDQVVNEMTTTEAGLVQRARLISFVFPEPSQYLLGRTVHDEWRYTFSALDYPEKNLQNTALYGLEEKSGTLTKHLSGGEVIRLHIACALETDNPIVILDLSANNLDRTFLKDLPQILEARCPNSTVIVYGIRPDDDIFQNFEPFTISAGGNVTRNKPGIGATLREETDTLAHHLKPRDPGSLFLSLKGVCRQRVTEPVNFDILQNRIYRLTGPNGSGKTTIGKILTGRIPNSEWAGKVETHNNVWRPNTTVMTNQYPRRSLLSLALSEQKKPVVSDLSQLKLLASTWACESDANLVFLDEPTAGMRLEEKVKLIELINSHPQKTFVIATHDEALSEIGEEIKLVPLK